MRTALASVFAWLLSASLALAGPISGYPPASSPLSGTEGLIGTQSGSTVQITPAQIAAYDAASGLKILNAAAYGIVCNGSTDNAAAFTAINAAWTAGTLLYFPPQTANCVTSKGLVAPSNATLYAFPGTVTLQAAAAETGNLLLTVSGVSNVTVYGVTFDGNINSIGNTNTNVVVYSASYVDFDNDKFQNTRGIPLLFSTNIQYSGVRNSTFYNVGMYWQTSSSQSDQIQGVAFCCGTVINTSASQGSPGTTLTFTSTSGVSVGNLVKADPSPYYTAGGSAVVSKTTTTVTLNQSTALAVPSGTGVMFSNNYGNYVLDNTFNLTGLDAISMSDQSHLRIEGNHCNTVGGAISGNALTSPTGAACIWISNINGGAIVGNSSYLAGQNGFDMSFLNGVTVNGNQVFNSGSGGFMLAGSRNVTVTGNTSENNSQNTATSSFTGGFSLALQTGNLAESNLVFVGNVALDNQGTQTQKYGLQLYGTGTTVSDLWVDDSNSFIGNLTSQFGGTGINPTVSSCGTSPTVNTVSTTASGQVTVGSTTTTCTITFGEPLTNAPKCIVTDEGAVALTYSTSNTAITVSGTSLGGTKLDYRCART